MQPIQATDAFAIAELELELFPDNCLNWKTLESEIQHGKGFVVYEGNRLVGYLLARTSGDLTDILRLGVCPDKQGLGYAHRLIQALLQSFQESHKVMLTVRKRNDRAIHFYRRYGFVIVGQLHDSWMMILHADSPVIVAARASV